jgi:hypothetical protein
VATLVVLVVPAVALGAEALKLPSVVSLLGGLAVLVPAVTGLLRSSSEWMRNTLEKLDKVREETDAKLAELDGAVDRAQDELAQSKRQLAETQEAEKAALAEAASLQGELQDLTPGRILGEFLQERSRSDDYRRHLGLLADIRRDLEKLEDLVCKNNLAGGDPAKAPNRIILYIDDLDRCPSKKVVEVLEAVHLLLAFELFVVVVAVDSRWLSVALTDELPALDRSRAEGQWATPQDYLEKIFQLPFWVQPLTAEGRRSLVHGLLEGTVGGAAGDGHADGSEPVAALTIGESERQELYRMLSRQGADPRLDAHLLALTSADLKFMESLAPLLGDTPRRVKRFVNVTQLLLAMQPPLERDTPYPDDRSVVAFLAAINSGMPKLASRLFDLVEPRSTRTLLEAVDSLTGVPREEVDVLTAWLRINPTWTVLPLGRLNVDRFDVVRRLSFGRVPALLAHISSPE